MLQRHEHSTRSKKATNKEIGTMASAGDLKRRALAANGEVRRARRLASALTQKEDQDRLLRYADEQKKIADELERRLAQSPRAVSRRRRSNDPEDQDLKAHWQRHAHGIKPSSNDFSRNLGLG